MPGMLAVCAEAPKRRALGAEGATRRNVPRKSAGTGSSSGMDKDSVSRAEMCHMSAGDGSHADLAVEPQAKRSSTRAQTHFALICYDS
jgi:hypothetical protein